MNALRSGELLPPTADTYDPDADMKELKNAFKKKKDTGEESYLSREQLMELRQVQNERIQVGFPGTKLHDWGTDEMPLYSF